MQNYIAYQDGIYAIDAHYVRPRMAAIHFIVENGRAAIVDTASNASLPYVTKALDALKIAPDAVDYIILTHIHLDHAGGASQMMQRFLNARLVVHPRGARHMIDPTKLMAGVSAVYGPEETKRLYGDILPIDEARIIQASDETVINLAGRELLCLDTPGHARHHISIVDRKSGNIFTGDIFGLSYRDFDTADGRQWLFPTTSPVQFEADAMHQSVDRLAAFKPEVMYLTHFSELRDVQAQAANLHRLIDASCDIARKADAQGTEGRHQRIRDGLTALFLDDLKAFGSTVDRDTTLELLETDIELNAQGLDVWLDSLKH